MIKKLVSGFYAFYYPDIASMHFRQALPETTGCTMCKALVARREGKQYKVVIADFACSESFKHFGCLTEPLGVPSSELVQRRGLLKDGGLIDSTPSSKLYSYNGVQELGSCLRKASINEGAAEPAVSGQSFIMRGAYKFERLCPRLSKYSL